MTFLKLFSPASLVFLIAIYLPYACATLAHPSNLTQRRIITQMDSKQRHLMAFIQLSKPKTLLRKKLRSTITSHRLAHGTTDL